MPAFARQSAALGLSAREFDEALEAIEYMVCRLPELFTRIRDSGYSVADYDGNPPLRVYFTYDDQFVYLVDIEWRDA